MVSLVKQNKSVGYKVAEEVRVIFLHINSKTDRRMEGEMNRQTNGWMEYEEEKNYSINLIVSF